MVAVKDEAVDEAEVGRTVHVAVAPRPTVRYVDHRIHARGPARVQTTSARRDTCCRYVPRKRRITIVCSTPFNILIASALQSVTFSIKLYASSLLICRRY